MRIVYGHVCEQKRDRNAGIEAAGKCGYLASELQRRVERMAGSCLSAGSLDRRA